MKEEKVGYKLSRDYKRLKELLRDGYKIVCFVDYSYRDNNYVVRDVCLGKYKSEYDVLELTARGICYFDYNENFSKSYKDYPSFECMCETSNVEFIDIKP